MLITVDCICCAASERHRLRIAATHMRCTWTGERYVKMSAESDILVFKWLASLGMLMVSVSAAPSSKLGRMADFVPLRVTVQFATGLDTLLVLDVPPWASEHVWVVLVGDPHIVGAGLAESEETDTRGSRSLTVVLEITGTITFCTGAVLCSHRPCKTNNPGEFLTLCHFGNACSLLQLAWFGCTCTLKCSTCDFLNVFSLFIAYALWNACPISVV